AEIRAMKAVERLSIKEITRRTGHSRNTIRSILRSPEPPSYGGRGGLNWPRCGGFNWPHLRPIGGLRFELYRARTGGCGGDGIQGGAVRADQA
ncbi:MAG: hypothetical protein ACRDL0_07655, partial [Thermoleophilaceae bacterium]